MHLQSQHIYASTKKNWRSLVRVGDLIKFDSNGMVGLLLQKHYMQEGDILWKVLWRDGTKSNRWDDELEVISASR